MVANKDPGKGHFYVSIIKSVIRIAAGFSLWMGADNTPLIAAGLFLIVAEFLGIIEEMV